MNLNILHKYRSIFDLFTCDGDIEYTGCVNTEDRGQKAIDNCPDCHLALIARGKVWGSIAIPRV
jgi:hypothetical protein